MIVALRSPRELEQPADDYPQADNPYYRSGGGNEQHNRGIEHCEHAGGSNFGIR